MPTPDSPPTPGPAPAAAPVRITPEWCRAGGAEVKPNERWQRFNAAFADNGTRQTLRLTVASDGVTTATLGSLTGSRMDVRTWYYPPTPAEVTDLMRGLGMAVPEGLADPADGPVDAAFLASTGVGPNLDRAAGGVVYKWASRHPNILTTLTCDLANGHWWYGDLRVAAPATRRDVLRLLDALGMRRAAT